MKHELRKIISQLKNYGNKLKEIKLRSCVLSVNSVWVRDDHELSIVSDLLPKFLCVEVRQALPKKKGRKQ